MHTSAAFTGPGDVPPQNVRASSIPVAPPDHLPDPGQSPAADTAAALSRFTGVDALDAILQPQIDSGYSRYDNPFDRPVSVDPVNSMDPIAVLDPATQASIEDTFNTARNIIGPLG